MHFLTIKSKKYIIQDIILTKYHYTTTPKHTQVQPLILSIMREIFLNFLSFLTELPELPERNFLNFLSFLKLPKEAVAVTGLQTVSSACPMVEQGLPRDPRRLTS